MRALRGDDFARKMLTVSELAYPHTVTLVGAEPPDPEARMYIVYAQNGQQLRQAMFDDVGTAPDGLPRGLHDLGEQTIRVPFTREIGKK